MTQIHTNRSKGAESTFGPLCRAARILDHRGHRGAPRKGLLCDSLCPLWFKQLLLYSFRDCDDPSFRILEGKFAHAIELLFQRHDDSSFTLLDGC